MKAGGPIWALAALLAAGCVRLGPGGAPVDLYDLTPPPAAALAAGARPRPWSLAVEVPAAAGGLAGDRIAVRPEANQLQHLAGARWAEPAPRMVQRLLVESLAASGGLAAVGRREAGFAADYRLVGDLQAFDVELAGDDAPPTVRVRLAVLLLSQPDQRVAAASTFEAAAPAEELSRGAIVAAFEAAFHRLAAELVGWLLAAPVESAQPGAAEGPV